MGHIGPMVDPDRDPVTCSLIRLLEYKIMLILDDISYPPTFSPIITQGRRTVVLANNAFTGNKMNIDRVSHTRCLVSLPVEVNQQPSGADHLDRMMDQSDPLLPTNTLISGQCSR